MRNFISSVFVLFVFSVAGMADLHAQFPQNHANPHNLASLDNPVMQAHHQAHQLAIQHQQQALDQHMRDHHQAMEMHKRVHEDSVKHACCLANDPNCTHTWHEVKPNRRDSNLLDRIRTWRENRRKSDDS